MNPERETKSVSAETTFNQDLSSLADLEPILWRLCERVSRRMKEKSLAGTSVTLKLKTRDFQTITRTRSGLSPTQLARRLHEPARALLRATADGSAYRLIGVGAGDLCPAEFADRGDLADNSAEEQSRMEAAIERLRDRFGTETIQTGLAFPFSADSRSSREEGRDEPSPPSGRNRRNPA